MSAKVKRKALNRGTAVHLGHNRVKFIWACGCTKVEELKDPGKRKQSESSTAMLVNNWRLNGVVLDQCLKHPDHNEKHSPLRRLNAWHPQPTLENVHTTLGKQKYQWRYIQQLTKTDVLSIVRNAEDDIPKDQREIFMANVLRVAAHLLRQVESSTSLEDAGVMFENRLERACAEIHRCVLYLDARITGVPVPCDDPNKGRKELPGFLQRQAD